MPTYTSSTTKTVAELPDNHTAVAEAAALGAAAEKAQAVTFEDVEGGLVARVLHRDDRLEVADLEHLLDGPRRARGGATIIDPEDFVSYVKRLGVEATTLWEDPDRSTVTAVLDDHTKAAPGWRSSLVTLQLRQDDEWRAWVQRSGRLGSQEEFAEFLEDHYASVVDPDAATMLEVASTFQARKSASFERGTRLTSGDVQLRWSETTTASAGSKGHLEVPEKFTVQLAPYLGGAPVQVVARLRYRISDGNLRIGFVLHRPEVVQAEAFDRIASEVRANVGLPCFRGTAPDSVRTSGRYSS